MGRTQKLAAIIKEGVRNPQKIKKGLKIVLLIGLSVLISYCMIDLIFWHLSMRLDSSHQSDWLL